MEPTRAQSIFAFLVISYITHTGIAVPDFSMNGTAGVEIGLWQANMPFQSFSVYFTIATKHIVRK
jgi:hypothetical protein